MAVHLVPQLFYDLIARVLSGALVLLAAAAVVLGPAEAGGLLLRPAAASVWLLLAVAGLSAYLTGFLLADVWEIVLGPRTARAERRTERGCKQRCLREHLRTQAALGKAPPPLTLQDLPRVSAMLDHLRLAASPEATRLLKLCAERRLCQVLVAGLGTLVVLHAPYLVVQPAGGRFVLELLLVGAVAVAARKHDRLHRHFVNGTCIAWLGSAARPSAPVEAEAGGAPADGARARTLPLPGVEVVQQPRTGPHPAEDAWPRAT